MSKVITHELAVLIPAKDEAESLPRLVERLHQTLTSASIPYHAIVIDDYSADATFRVAKKLEKKYPLKVFKKEGKPGKAYAILEAAKHTTAPYVAFIDADLQYPPEALVEMLSLTQTAGLIIAKRHTTELSWHRRALSAIGKFLTGRVLFNMPYDVQSGLKLFKRDIINHLSPEDVSPWTIDIPLIVMADRMGYTIREVEIEFVRRTAGESKIKVVQTVGEIVGRALKYRFSAEQPLPIAPQAKNMVGAGLLYRKHRYITHTQLPHHTSAIHTVSWWQRLLALSFVALCVYAAVMHSLHLAIVIVAILSFIYFSDVIFNLVLVLRSLQFPPEISTTQAELSALKDKDLPTYTILCPLYKEAHMVPHFVESIAKLEWPKSKLDVMLLLEEDDVHTIAAAQAMKLPSFVRIVVVPDSLPKTKPKACNYGLNLAKGEYLVIFDAEDMPDPLQLKKVFVAFQKAPTAIKCIQAKLNYYNPSQNLLTRFFTAEYSLWFDVILTGLQSFQTTIPLGGTSNHFRTQDLLALQGWDPFNVTEDCDLGVRLFKEGGRTAIVDSVTLEEANSNLGNWIRQRSRWIKGYMQTYLLHMRHPLALTRAYGWHALIFQLTVGGKIAFLLINPLMWLLTISYFALYARVGEAIEALFPSVIFYMAATSLVFGNFLFIYYYMIGLAKREQWSLLKYVLLVPFYWLAASYAAGIALYQLIVKPHYWEKTIHGLHLKKEELKAEAKELTNEVVAAVATEALIQKKHTPGLPFHFLPARLQLFASLKRMFSQLSFTKLRNQLANEKYRGGLLFVGATIAANGLNMLTNLYLGHELLVAEFATLNTFMSLFYLLSIPLQAFSSAMNVKTASVLGKHNTTGASAFWNHVRVRATTASLLLMVSFALCIPMLSSFVGFSSTMPLIVFTTLIYLGLVNAVDLGYLRGRLLFGALAVSTFAEPLSRLLFSIVLDQLKLESLVYLSIPLSTAVSTLLVFLAARVGPVGPRATKEFRLPKAFFVLALIAKLSNIAFFSLDNILVAHFLDAQTTGQYALLGLIGKMIFFAGSLSAGFILPLVSHHEGKGTDSSAIFNRLVALTSILSIGAYAVLGLGLPAVAPFYLGEKMNSIAFALPLYGLGILFYTISQTIVQFHLAKKEYTFALISFTVALLQVIGLSLFHDSLLTVVLVMAGAGMLNFVALLVVHLTYRHLRAPLHNVLDFFDLFAKLPKQERLVRQKDSYHILIYNWRDTRHTWAGGAEEYVHKIAKRLVRSGHQVTLFCGNDGTLPRSQTIDGVQIVRRGGFFTVYIWACLYYLVKFRRSVDIVIDSENGIPFLTPLYVRQPIFLLIHHIHQEVFRTQLRFPLNHIATMIESDLMTWLYQPHHKITVSQSSKEAMINLGLGDENSIEVINPGIRAHLYAKGAKTKYPSVVYVGRLKSYKKVDRALRAFVGVLEQLPTARFDIVGSGESEASLKALTAKLKIEQSVTFHGRVSDEQKAELLARAWVAVQPSMIEGWGITVIEANACGTPVVASDVSGLRDSVVDHETGLLVAPELGARGVEAALLTILTKRALRTKLSSQALAWSKKFSWEASAQQLCTTIARHVKQHIAFKGEQSPSAEVAELEVAPVVSAARTSRTRKRRRA